MLAALRKFAEKLTEKNILKAYQRLIAVQSAYQKALVMVSIHRLRAMESVFKYVFVLHD